MEDEDFTDDEENKEEPEEEPEEEEEEDKETKKETTSRTTTKERTSKWMLYANLTWIGSFFVMIFIKKWDRGKERDMVMYQAVQQFFITLPMMVPVLNYIYFFVWIVLTIMAMVKANSGECWEMPFVSEYVHKALDRDQ